MTEKRVFFGFDVICPWPQNPIEEKTLSFSNRHFTFLFLGKQEVEKLLPLLQKMPSLPFFISPAGFFDRCIVLPSKRPSVVALQFHLETYAQELKNFHYLFIQWLLDQKIEIKELEKEKLLFHVSVSRKPQSLELWEQTFKKRPFFLSFV